MGFAVELSSVDDFVSRYHDETVRENELGMTRARFGRGCKVAPLLEVKCNPLLHSEVSESTNPIGMHWSGSRSAFPAHDDPVNAFFLCVATEIDGAEQRLA